MSKPLKIFITYSHKNTNLKDELITWLAVLKSEGLISIWHDNEILPGDEWRDTIFSNLADSDILLYLTSVHSLASENCNKEMVAALNAKIRVIPIILDHCDWKNHQLSDLQALPDKGVPIHEWQPESKGWLCVIDGIRKVVKKMQSQADSSIRSAKQLRAQLAFQRGNFLMILGAIGIAIEAYTDAIELNSKNADIYYNRGVAYCHKRDDVLGIIEDFNKAIEDFNKAIDLNPNYFRAYSAASHTHYELGSCYYAEGNDDLAIKNYTQAIQLQPEYFEAYQSRGTAYRDKREYDLAIKDYTKTIEISPNHVIGYYGRGVTYQNKGEYDLAIKDYTKAIELNPNPPLYNNRGNAYVQKGKYNLAINDYNEAIKVESDLAEPLYDAVSYYNRGMVLLHLQEWEKAKEDLTTARDKQENIIIQQFHKEYENVADFEQKHEIKMPEDIATLLTPL